MSNKSDWDRLHLVHMKRAFILSSGFAMVRGFLDPANADVELATVI